MGPQMIVGSQHIVMDAVEANNSSSVNFTFLSGSSLLAFFLYITIILVLFIIYLRFKNYRK